MLRVNVTCSTAEPAKTASDHSIKAVFCAHGAVSPSVAFFCGFYSSAILQVSLLVRETFRSPTVSAGDCAGSHKTCFLLQLSVITRFVRLAVIVSSAITHKRFCLLQLFNRKVFISQQFSP